MIRFLDLTKQYDSIRREIDEAIASVIRESAFIGGKRIAAFEERFASYQSVRHCIGVGNGTDAIEIALEALALPRESEVLVPANSFIATSEAVTRTGHRVVFCDCDPRTYTLSIDDAAGRITPRTRAIVPVHLYGHACDMDGVMELASRHGLKVVEDCAQAHGAEYKGRQVGGIGDLGTFSFYPGKNLGAYGDGGAITTNDSALAKRCRMIANHGRIDKYDHAFEGRNSRLDGIQAAILEVKLKHLDHWTSRRRTVAQDYLSRLEGLPGIVLPHVAAWASPVWHLFVIQTDGRDLLREALRRMDVETGIHYPIALPELAAYAYLGTASTPTASALARRILSLPMGEHLEPADVASVAEAIITWTRQRKSHS